MRLHKKLTPYKVTRLWKQTNRSYFLQQGEDEELQRELNE